MKVKISTGSTENKVEALVKYIENMDLSGGESSTKFSFDVSGTVFDGSRVRFGSWDLPAEGVSDDVAEVLRYDDNLGMHFVDLSQRFKRLLDESDASGGKYWAQLEYKGIFGRIKNCNASKIVGGAGIMLEMLDEQSNVVGGDTWQAYTHAMKEGSDVDFDNSSCNFRLLTNEVMTPNDAKNWMLTLSPFVKYQDGAPLPLPPNVGLSMYGFVSIVADGVTDLVQS